MLSYQHGYHAGNCADVVKHLVLTRILHYLTLKDKPIFYFESHAGKGLYDLTQSQSQKTKEYQSGIKILWDERDKLPSEFNLYLDAIKSLNSKDTLCYYPGSPYLAMYTLRDYDRMYLCELHPEEYKFLKDMPKRNKKVFCSNSEGMSSLNAIVPPLEKRGLFFIDPSFEIKEDYKNIPQQIIKAFLKFSTGVYCLWYPLFARHSTRRLIHNINEMPEHKYLNLEFYETDIPLEGMTGCGVYIINPPYTLKDELETVCATLTNIFNPGSSFYRIKEK